MGLLGFLGKHLRIPFATRFGSLTGAPAGGGGVFAIGDYVNGLFASVNCFVSGDIQFTANNQVLVAWEDEVDNLPRLGVTLSPRGRIGAGAFGAPTGPDYELRAVRMTATDFFNADADGLSDMDLATWTYEHRISWEAAGSGISRHCGMKHSVLANGCHISLNKTTNIVTVHAPGTDNGDLSFTAAIDRTTGYTIISAYDGVDHFADIYDEDGVLIEALSTSHSGTTTDGDDLIIHDGANAVRVRKTVHWNAFADATARQAIADNSITEDLPGS